MSGTSNISKQCDMDLQAAIGGVYVLQDGRTFWVDHVVVSEIMNRVRPIIGAECERKYLAGTRNPNTADVGGGA